MRVENKFAIPYFNAIRNNDKDEIVKQGKLFTEETQRLLNEISSSIEIHIERVTEFDSDKIQKLSKSELYKAQKYMRDMNKRAYELRDMTTKAKRMIQAQIDELKKR